MFGQSPTGTCFASQAAAIKKAIQKKVDMTIADPIGLGEPLRGNFRGYYSCPAKKNFLIVYLFCRICRGKNDGGGCPLQRLSRLPG